MCYGKNWSNLDSDPVFKQIMIDGIEDVWLKETFKYTKCYKKIEFIYKLNLLTGKGNWSKQ